MKSEREDRRQFLKKAAWRFAGLAGLVGAADIADILREHGEPTVFSAIRRRLFVTEPEQVVDAFLSASRGTMMLYYQLFFPVYITGKDLDKVLQLQQLTSRLLITKHSARDLSRLSVLPVVAASHALASSDSADSDILRDIISTTIRSSLDPEDKPNSGVLGSSWRAMNAALLRTPNNWSSFRAGQVLVDLAQSVCLRFLAESNETLPLINPATSAWQFLLAYQRALWSRHDDIDLRIVNGAIAAIQSRSSSRRPWLDAVTKLYSSCFSYEQMPPQSYEAVVGRPLFLDGSRNRAVADLFCLIGLQTWFNTRLISNGKLSSPYMQTTAHASEMSKDFLTFLGNYGVGPSDWANFKKRPTAQLLAPEAVSEIDHAFTHYDEYFAADTLQKKERAHSSWLSTLVPFRQLEEFNVCTKAYTRRALLLALLGTGGSQERRLKCWALPAQLFLPTGQARSECSMLNLEKALSQDLPLQESKHVAYFSELEEAARSELLQKTIITLPARQSLVGSDVGFIAGERPTMEPPKRGVSDEVAAWYPLDVENAVALHFTTETSYLEASALAHGLENHEIRFPGRQTIILNRALQSLFGKWRPHYIEEKVISGANVPKETLRQLRHKRLFGTISRM